MLYRRTMGGVSESEVRLHGRALKGRGFSRAESEFLNIWGFYRLPKTPGSGWRSTSSTAVKSLESGKA